MSSTGTSPAAKAGDEDAVQHSHIDETKKVPKSGKKGLQQQKLASIKEMFSLATPWEMAIFHASHVGAAVGGIGQPLLCVFFGSLLGEITEDSPPDVIMDKISEVATNMAFVGVVSAFATWLRSSGLRWFSQQMVFKYRVLYLQSVLHQDVAWFDAHELASLPSQMAVDAEKIIESFNDNLGSSLMAVWGCVSGCLFAYIFGWQLALVLSSTIPFHAAGVLYMAKATEAVQGESQDWYSKASVVVEECLYAFRTVVSFGGEKRELALFEHAVEQARKSGVTNGFKIGLSFGYANMFMYLGYALSYYVGSVFIDAGLESWYTGDVYDNSVILAIFACNFIGGFFLGNIPSGVISFTQGRAAMGRFLDVYNYCSIIERRKEDEREQCPAIETMEIREVHFSYPTRPEVPVLRGLSLKIGKGQKVAVVGESGSGKSTVMALLERFYDPISGVVLVNEQDIKTIAVKSLRRSIGYVGQEPVLFTTTVKENILQGAAQTENMQAELDQVIVEAELGFIMDLPQGLSTYVGSGGSQFSGGQKQRIAIARALIKKTSMLFFDEATSALDNKAEKMIQRTIARIGENAAGNLAMVSIAHRLSTVRHSDVIYVMSKGEVVELGTHTELVRKRGTYYALASTQQVAEEQQEEMVRNREPQGETQATDGAVVPVNVNKNLDQQGSPETEAPVNLDEMEAERKKKLVKEYKVPLLRMMSYCKPEWFWLIPALLGSLGEGIAMPVSGVAIIRGASSLANPDMEEMRSDAEFYSIFLVGIALTQFLCGTLSKGCISIVGEALTKRLRVELLRHYFRQEVGFHDDPKHTPAQLGQALEIWANRVATLVKAWAGQFQAICSVIAGLVVAFWHSWEVSLGVLAALPIMVGTNVIGLIILFGGSKARAEGLLRAQQLVSDAVQNPRVCHACANEDEVVNLFKSFVSSANISLKVIVLNGLVVGICGGMMFWVLAGGYYYCGYLQSEGIRSNNEVTIAFMSIFFGAFAAGLASTSIGDITSAKVAAHDLFATLDRKSKIDSLEPTGETPVFSNPMDAGRISFEAVRFSYPFRPDVQVLKGITFEVQQGQSAGLVGPSGSGKSTVMALIQRFYDPDEGAVWVGAEKKALSNINIRWWRTQLGFVGQEPILFNTTVRANIAYGVSEDNTVSDEWLEECARRSNLAFLDNEPQRFDTEVGPRGSRLSGGQKQRVAICRALLRNPPVLLFDEATSALDTQSEQIVQSALEVAREGRTSFSIAHRLSTIAGCQVILVVSAGIVVEQGCHDELLAAGGVYSKLVEAASQNNSSGE